MVKVNTKRIALLGTAALAGIGITKVTDWLRVGLDIDQKVRDITSRKDMGKLLDFANPWFIKNLPLVLDANSAYAISFMNFIQGVWEGTPAYIDIAMTYGGEVLEVVQYIRAGLLTLPKDDEFVDLDFGPFALVRKNVDAKLHFTMPRLNLCVIHEIVRHAISPKTAELGIKLYGNDYLKIITSRCKTKIAL